MASKKSDYIFSKTTSGEGYSDPEFKLFNDYDSAQYALRLEIKSLEGEGYLVEESDANDFYLEMSDPETNYYRLQIIEVPAEKFHLIFYTEPNEVEVNIIRFL